MEISISICYYSGEDWVLTCNLEEGETLFDVSLLEHFHCLHEQGNLVFVLWVVEPSCNFLAGGKGRPGGNGNPLNWIGWAHDFNVSSRCSSVLSSIP